MRTVRSVLFAFLALALVTNVAQAATYEIGPGKTYTTIGSFPWEDLSAGDTVKIYYKVTPYYEKFGVFTQGTSGSPITVQGVAGEGGELPIIDGDDATSRSAAYLDYWSENRQVIKVGGSSIPESDPDTPPMYVIIENLDVKSGRDPYDFTDGDGNPASFTGNASSIRVECGEYITIRNCIIRDSGNGFLTSGSAKEILVEGCHLYDNGEVSSALVHNVYTEAHGITYQWNHMAPLRADCDGCNLKDRSAGTIVRYNWIEGGARELHLVESYDYETIRDDPRYGKEDMVYGNIIIEPYNADDTIVEIMLYGGDMGGEYEQYYREGPLQVYNNTICSDRTDQTRFIRLKTEDQSAELFNNIYYCSEANSTKYILSSGIGTCHTSHNWFNTGYNLWGATEDNPNTNISGSDPDFTNYGGGDFTLTSQSDCIDEGKDLSSPVLPKYELNYEYVEDQDYQSRASDGDIDIGAYEYGSTAALTIDTTSLPDGTVSVAYSSYVHAYGGEKAYTWSIYSGSLPSGLSLDSSTGAITGTPTSGGTSEFTVQVTDSAGTPDTDTQALSITVVSAGSDYEFASSDGESNTSSTSWQTKVTLQFTPSAAEDWVVLAFAEFKDSGNGSSPLARLVIDSTAEAEMQHRPKDGGDWFPFITMKVLNLSAAQHTMTLEYRSQHDWATAYVRRARILAIRKGDLTISSAAAYEGSSLQSITDSYVSYVSTSFTPASTCDYLLMYTIEHRGEVDKSNYIRAKLADTVLDQCEVRTRRGYDDVYTWASFKVVSLGASQQTISVDAMKETDDDAHYIRRARVTAIRLDGRFADAVSQVADGESTTTSTSFQQKLTKTWNNTDDGSKWLLVVSGDIKGSSTSYSTEVQAELDNSTTLLFQDREPTYTGDWMNFSGLAVETLSSGNRTVDVDYRSENAGATARIQYVHFAAIPLD